MKHEPGISPQSRRLPEPTELARARDSYAAGGGVEHVVVGQWLLTSGKPGRKSFADWLAQQNG